MDSGWKCDLLGRMGSGDVVEEGGGDTGITLVGCVLMRTTGFFGVFGVLGSSETKLVDRVNIRS